MSERIPSIGFPQGGRARLVALLLSLVLLAGLALLPDTRTQAEPAAQTPAPLILTITHTGSDPPGGGNFLINSTGTVGVTAQNTTDTPLAVGSVTLSIQMPTGMIFNTPVTSSSGLFTCSQTSSTVNCVNTGGELPAFGVEAISFPVTAPTTPGGPFRFTVIGFVPGFTPVVQSELTEFFILAPTLTPSLTPTTTSTPTRTPTLTLFPSITPFPTITPIPTSTAIPTATLIPNPPTRTPPPRPANAGQAIGAIPRPGVRVVVDRDNVNIRIIPAIGAEVIAFVNAGTTYDILARSPDNEWVQVIVGNQLGWLGTAVVAIIAGDLNAAPVADPRTIPYGGFENPRAGITSASSAITGRLANSGLRIRGGPGLGYPVLANAPRFTVFPLLGQALGGSWMQVNFEGTLGWAATEFIEFQQDLSVIASLPEDGIVADGLPISEPTTDSYTDTLRLLLARVELAQPSLDAIRAIWTSIAIGDRAACGSYPPRPSDYNIPNPVLAPFFGTLDPLQTDFNQAMGLVRQAIDLLIDICSRPQPPAGFVGQAVVQQALDAINRADGLFASLRARLRELLPPDVPVGDDQCLFTFNRRSEVLDRLFVNTPKIVTLRDPNRRVVGLCFDAGAGQTLSVQGLRVTGNAQARLTVTSFDNPTNFLGVAEFGSEGTTARISSILFTQTGRYLLLISDLDAGARGVRLQGEIAVLLTDTSASLVIDPATGNVIVQQGIFIPSATPFTSLGGGVLPGGTPVIGGVVCPSVTFTCQQLQTCEQARACVIFNPALDPLGSGTPCPNLCGGG